MDDINPLIQRGSSIKPPKGPLCKLCRKPCAEPVWDEKGRGPYCSASCHTDDTKGLSQKELRALAWERDQGQCAECPANCKAVEEMKSAFATEALWVTWAKKTYHFKDKHIRDGLWQADHKEERAVGGRDSLDNIQTLCGPCHDKKTAAFNSRRFRKRGFGRG